MNEHDHCQCTARIGNHSVGQWQEIPQEAPRKPVEGSRNCACGCNDYIPAVGRESASDEFLGPIDADALDIPALPIQLDYADDVSDDHEYVSIKITELSDMVSAIRSCTCHAD